MSGAYPLSSWNVLNLSCRTSNHMEGWHSKLKKVVGKAHPNVFEIVRVFKMEQAAVDVAVAQLLAGVHPPVRSRAAIEKDTKIEELKAKFANNVISMDNFVCGLSGLGAEAFTPFHARRTNLCIHEKTVNGNQKDKSQCLPA